MLGEEISRIIQEQRALEQQYEALIQEPRNPFTNRTPHSETPSPRILNPLKDWNLETRNPPP